MLEEIVPGLKNFRDRLYRFFPSRRDAAMELVDALSSNNTATSVVEITAVLRGFWMNICQRMQQKHCNKSRH